MITIRLDVRRAAAVAGIVVAVALAASVTTLMFRYAFRPSHTAARVQTTASPVASPVETSPSANPQLGSIAGCPTGQLVTTSDELTQALASAAPGTVIVMQAGTYSGNFVAKNSGTEAAPITLCGARDAVIDGGDIKVGYTFYLSTVDWWKVMGFTIQGGQKGLVADHAHHNLIKGLFVRNIGDEGIHLREFSTDNTVDGNTVRNTGLHNKKFGEGIYVGTAHSNWCKYTSCAVDNSDRNVISNNDISNTTAENIDIKEGTTGGVIENNHLSGVGMVRSAASAWINVKGNSWTVTGNVGVTSIKDGFQVHEVYKGWGLNNVFRTNRAEVNGPGYGFYVQSRSLAATIACDNVAVGAASGLSNQSCGGA
ncbi:MAG TPA: right-handed parallel beta-helix repeat-containing protein [Candidatus Dormibacteraeota bacterium]|nr:right-handed parallel beta-helix repeat-containing protein [Candidatus Dormibacteraeota bacterium]